MLQRHVVRHRSNVEKKFVYRRSDHGLTWISRDFQHGANHIGLVPAFELLNYDLRCHRDIPGLDRVGTRCKHTVFHCGTALRDGNVITNGGRVLIVVVSAEHLITAAALATRACEDVDFDGRQFRKDIAHRGISR